MSELLLRLAAISSEMVKFTKDGEPIIPDRAKRILAHYEREIAKSRMTITTAVDKALADYSGSNNGEIRK